MIEQPVGGEVFVDRTERRVGLRWAAGTGHTAGCVDDDAGRLDEASAQERSERQRGRGDLAARRGYQTGAGEVLTEQLRQAVHGVGQQARRLVLLAIPLRIERRIVQTEVGSEVDDVRDPGVEQAGHDLL